MEGEGKGRKATGSMKKLAVDSDDCTKRKNCG